MEYIPFERPIADLEQKIDELRRLAATQAVNLDREILELEDRARKLRRQIFSKLTPYETTQIARHPRRPTSLDIIRYITSSFIELHGDRNFLDDRSVVGGLARIDDRSVIIVGHQKGRGTKDNILRNFGMPRPEGYRKALRLMSMAERFSLPIVTLIDTPGAYPGVGAEERGQSEAIAKNIFVMSRLKVPIVTVIVGEGGSGGALALAVANRVHMLEFAIYSVISPEGCASILMKDSTRADVAADALKLTAPAALELGVVDSMIVEPEGGAHRSPDMTALAIKTRVLEDLAILDKVPRDDLRTQRVKKFLAMGADACG